MVRRLYAFAILELVKWMGRTETRLASNFSFVGKRVNAIAYDLFLMFLIFEEDPIMNIESQNPFAEIEADSANKGLHALKDVMGFSKSYELTNAFVDRAINEITKVHSSLLECDYDCGSRISRVGRARYYRCLNSYVS